MSDYHSRPEISRSMIATFIESKRLYEAMYVTKALPNDGATDAMILGTLTHSQLLEPDVDHRIVVPPAQVLTKDGKRSGNAYKEWCAANPTLIPVKASDFEISKRCVASVHKTIGMMINHPKAMREREVYWTHANGLNLRAKLDLIVPTTIGLHIPDIKTTARLDKFHFDVSDGLYLQHAHYRAAIRAEFGVEASFWFCAVEKSGTFRVRAFELAEDYSAEADAKYEQALADMLDCHERNDFSELGEGEVSILYKPQYF